MHEPPSARKRDAKLTYAADGTYSTADAARREIREHVDKFWDEVDRYHEEVAKAKAANAKPPAPPVWAMRIDTGVGKTQEVIRSYAERRARGGDGATATRPLIYSVDRHKLGDAIERRFAELGIDARVFRGHMAEDPENPGELMCLNLPALELAMKCHANIAETCCKRGKKSAGSSSSAAIDDRCPMRATSPTFGS